MRSDSMIKTNLNKISINQNLLQIKEITSLTNRNQLKSKHQKVEAKAIVLHKLNFR
jgi:hypothetical protein